MPNTISDTTSVRSRYSFAPLIEDIEHPLVHLFGDEYQIDHGYHIVRRNGETSGCLDSARYNLYSTEVMQ